MTVDGILQGKRKTVVHQAVASPETPQRRRTHLIGCEGIFGNRLDGNAVARPYVVQQEIAVGMYTLVTQGIRDCEGTGVNGRARRRRDDGRHVADCAPDLAEELFAGLDVIGYWPAGLGFGGLA